MDNKERFKELVYESIHREGVADLMQWLEGTDFYTAPASTRFHGSHEGGLLAHSLAVYDRMVEVVELFGGEYTDESITIVALFHDLCKVGVYKTEMRWRKDVMQRWEQYPTYKFEEDFCFGGHGSKSMYLVQNFMKLLPEEAVAINCHMGAWDSTTYSNPTAAYEQCLLAWELHVADEAADFIDKV